MNKAAILFLFFLTTFTVDLYSQKPIRCHTDERTEMIKKLDPEYYNSLQEPIPYKPESRQMMAVVTIPVHVIIVHPPGQGVGTGVNFSMDHILSQIDVLNEDFRRTNGDAGNTPPVFAADDSEIEFCMASVDPSGNPTDGVTRYGTSQNLNNDEFAIKSATGWDRNNYLNIWVGPNLGGLLGWAYLPTTGGLPNATLDGVVVASGTFGGPGYGTTNNYDLGRTSTHEVGHYLGLRHIWRNNGCGLDDGFPDTPLQDDENYGCPNHPSPSCGNAGDMFMNYMDYVNDDCMNAFTTDQGNYMHEILNTSRSSLLDAANTYCDAGGVPLVLELVTTIDVLCFGESTGEITVQATGGTAPYTYAIDNGNYQNNNTFTGVAAGTHVVSAQDNDGTIIDIEVILNEPPQLIPVIDVQENVTCFGDGDGLVIVNATGGSLPPGNVYQYNIDGGAFSPNNVFNNLVAGSHTIIVQDANGCESEINAFIIEPEELLTFPEEVFNITCFGENNGLISVISVGGNPTYTYSIDQINYQPAPVFFDLAAGNYLMSTLDQNGCMAETVFSITEPDLLEVNLLQLEPVLCFGENTGSITLEAVGGTAGYEYSIDGVNYQPNPTFDNLSSGSYFFSVLDANDCYIDINVSLDAPEELVLELIEQTSAGCSGQENGTITVTSTGGAGGNTFIYDTQNLTGDTVTFTNVPAGTITIMVVDDNTCTTDIEVEVAESASIELETVNLENVSCENAMDGTIEVQGNGGSGIYLFNINNGSYGPENIFTGLASGSYIVGIIDDAGCEGTISLSVTAPDPIITEIESQVNPDCFGMPSGSVDVSASGGTGTFNYILDNETNLTGLFNDLPAGTYQILVIDANGCSEEITIELEEPEEVQITEFSNNGVDCFGNNSGSFIVNATGGNNTFEYVLNAETNNTGEFNNLVAGTYLVEATDGNGCSATIEVIIAEPVELEVSIDYVSNVSCAGEESGVIQIQASGGSGTITFTLGAETNNTGLFENLMEGSYTIDVVDENACNTNISADVASTPELEIAEEELSPISCFGEQDGFIQLLVSGGNGNFDFTVGAETNNTGLFENLAPGLYTAEVTDGSACSGTYEFEITEPAELETGIDAIMDVSCFGVDDGIAELIVIGGTGLFTFDNGITSNNDGSFSNLAAGLYQFTVTDENGCTAVTEATIEQPEEIEASILETQDVGCNGIDNGSFVVSAIGGTGVLEYTANNETNTSGEFNNLTAGTYPVIIIDDNACELAFDINIAEVAPIELEVIETNMNNCFGDSSGAVEAIASGGSGSLEYTLDIQTNNDGVFENLPAGIYELLVSDTTGCTNTTEIIIDQPAEVTAGIIENLPVDCFGGNTGFVQAEAQGGTGTYTYTLGTETNNSGIFLNLLSGDYQVIIVDENDCSTTIDVSVSQPGEIESEIVDLQNIDCADVDGVGSVQVQATGGSGNFQYTLGAETNGFGIFENLPAGPYEVQIIDANGCSGVQSFDIVEGANLDVLVQEVEAITCFGEENGSIQVSAQGGSGIYDFVLGTVTNTTGFFDNLNSGLYTVVVIDGDGCESTMEYEVTQPDEITLASLESVDATCFGEATGTLNVQGQGGDGNFNYTLNSENNTAGIFTDLAAGDYILTISDGTGCTTSLPVTVEEPQAVDVNVVESVAVSCYGADDGMLQINGIGGTGAYTYTLGLETNSNGTFENLPGGIYNLIVVDDNGCSNTSELTIMQPEIIQPEIISLQSIGCGGNDFGAVQVEAIGGTGTLEYTLDSQTNTTGNFDDLVAGDYTLVVTDENGCTALITFSVIETGELEAAVMTNTPASCFGESDGTIEVNVTSGGGTYTYTLGTESNNNGIFSNLSAGNYSVDITDGGGCNTTVNFVINQPDALVAEAIELQPLTCFEANDAVIQLEAFGGNGPYTFYLNNETNTFGGFENLAAGIYEAVITDQNDCSFILEIVIIEPDAIQTDIIESQEPACHGGSEGLFQLVAQGGSIPFEFTLGTETNNTGFFENLSAGNYQVLITDANGCSSTETISISQPSVLISGVLNINSVLCFGGDDAVIFIGADGGTPGYQFELDGEINGGGVFFDLSAGSYTVNVTDANACTSETTVVVTQPEEIFIDASNTQDDTGTGNGKVTLSVNGGIAPYLFSLDGIDYTSSSTFENLSVGTYTAYVKDSNGCISQITFTIEMGTFISNPNQGVTDIQIFPNPFSNELQLQVDLVNAQKLELQMYTIHGQELFYYKADFGAGTSNVNLDIPNNLPAGAYIISVKNEEAYLGHYKLVKQ
jgi:pregnancy-associated plasma protein-A/SprB-like repeat protein/type IX secretion system substrate protein